MFTVEVTGMRELEKTMDNLMKDMRNALEVGVDEAAEYAAGLVRNKAPLGPTGNLKKSIGTKTLPRKKGYPAVTLVGARWPEGAHAHLVEFGTVHAQPYPFFRFAINEARGGIKARIREAAKGPIDRRR